MRSKLINFIPCYCYGMLLFALVVRCLGWCGYGGLGVKMLVYIDSSLHCFRVLVYSSLRIPGGCSKFKFWQFEHVTVRWHFISWRYIWMLANLHQCHIVSHVIRRAIDRKENGFHIKKSLPEKVYIKEILI